MRFAVNEAASLFVVALPRSGSSATYVRVASMLGLRRPSWTSDGEILNLDRYSALRGPRHDECAKFITRDRDPALFAQLTEFLDTTVRRRGFAYKDVVQPFVVTQWSGLHECRVLHIRRDPAEVACSMLRQRWFYPVAAGGSNGAVPSNAVPVLEPLVTGLLAAERALERAPAARIDFDDLICRPEALASVLAQLYPEVEKHVVLPATRADIAASVSRREGIRRSPEYVVLRALIDRARESAPQSQQPT
jgi:hypothetical protein